MVFSDITNTALLAVAVIGIVLTFWQVRKSTKTQRAQFLKDLYSTIVTDQDICDAVYKIEYSEFVYDSTFHGSEFERKLDRLLAFLDLVSELYRRREISKQDTMFFRYHFLRVFGDPEVQSYLEFISSFYKRVGVKSEPYESFNIVTRKLVIERDAGIR
jgi:hypothetical protein